MIEMGLIGMVLGICVLGFTSWHNMHLLRKAWRRETDLCRALEEQTANLNRALDEIERQRAG